MSELRHLARSRDGRVIHRDDCRHARAPWYWADSATADELLHTKLSMGYRTCRTCQPSLFLPSDIDGLDPPERISTWKDIDPNSNDRGEMIDR